ncbi:gibberellin 20 oxidase 2-like [Vicia villosa]|uniref:gibberellin 20 oxidase 2-like n=1 Tax=Vicia villosa TaxID=3911 RepID=UPI00273C8A82|nr:gibberellin 20 oxidase 2-like [Vicia villosa]XP_058743673.1 gibberellin 20 oxidase 2-like [Vicia villosa]
MDSGLCLVSSNHQDIVHQNHFYDPTWLQKQRNVPTNFVWPKEYLVNANEEFQAPLIDLEGFLKGNEEATNNAAMLISKACSTHGFFQVVNHGVDLSLVGEAYDQMDAFFKLPIDKKLGVRKMKGSMWGYSGAHADRFSSKLPWKETLSFPFHDNNSFEPVVTNYFNSTSLREDLKQTGVAFQKYCEAMKKLGMKLMEILAISLGVDRLHYKYLFEDGCSIMRCNYYPSCQEPSVALGTGPHCDPTTLTILHQDQVGGLDVFADEKWQTVRPRPDAFVVNIGDTFTALSNGRYKSCLHRAVVNRYKERRSLAFFLCPKQDKMVRPPQDIVNRDGTKEYPDFTWSQLLQFTQKYYRADEATLQNFTKWLLSSNARNHLP